MSSMHRKLASLFLLGLVCLSAPAQCQDGSEWDRARAQLIASQPGAIGSAIVRWRELTMQSTWGFADYAGFLLAYPGFPDEYKLRLAAEKSLETAAVEPARLIAFFDRFPPMTNPARAQYALALAAYGRPESGDLARAAWRGGSMSDAAEATILARYGSGLAATDHDARMNALLWDGNVNQAARLAANPATPLSPGARAALLARLDLLQGGDAAGAVADGATLADAGYVYSRARRLYQSGQGYAAAGLLASRPPLAQPPLDPRKWINLQLQVARDASTADAVRIAERIDDALPPGTDIPRLIFPIRDDYTSLMWLGGTGALWVLHDPVRAAPLFARYARAARTPQTRAKGFYWAGRALAEAGQATAALPYFEQAAAYPDQYHGMLALERLGRPLPPLADPPHPAPTQQQRAAFYATPLAQAVREVARDGDWQTAVRFFRAIAEQAESESDYVLVADLARGIGRRDLGVILGQAATNDRLSAFRSVSFPRIPIPLGTDWTIVHAISRQESQFSPEAVSRAGARGLMQLMPGTAMGQAKKLGLPYDFSSLTRDPLYNMTLGDALFAHLMDLYAGSYPLAIAAYNAGPGNVNKWLRDLGDPRQTGNWVDWIEHIPFTETRGYVAHVLENAVVYEALYPDKARYRGPNPLSHFLGKQTPG
ncbi:MAG: lytic transglycosylase domain-containing protein [Sphingomonadales bacterium]|nr:lytic transglycosylase domain-containing protein [Sphingomonadales bacterium]